MLTREGCETRRRRLFERLSPTPDWAIVADPRHLNYLTNFFIDPESSLAAAAFALLLVERGGRTTLVTDNQAAKRAKDVWVDRVEAVRWYNHQDSVIDRRLAVIENFVSVLPPELPETVAVESLAVPVELVHHLTDDVSRRGLVALDPVLIALRERKDPDEIELVRRSARAGEAGHACSWQAARTGATELEVYRAMAGACVEAAGMPVVVYGDFASGPRTWTERGGGPTGRRLEAGDLMILDFSVVVRGYRADFTNTLVVGGKPNADQRRLFALCEAALGAGAAAARAGAAARAVWEATNTPLEHADPAYRLPHHAGHGIGLAHPEPPILVPQSSDTLAAGNLITLEPGVYVPGVAGIRIENNYLVTGAGLEQITHHRIGLTA
jgi:Xaa-Pro aminopeptidase